jgi:hypothetical protein
MNDLSCLAYIDPASGTLILQAVLAAVIGGIAFFRRTIAGFLRRLVFSRRPVPAGEEEAATDHD